MKIIYKALDGREFDTEEKCIKHENKLLKLKRVFDKFVDEGVFPNYKIPTFYHNYDVSSLGKPSKSDWSYRYRGYVLVHGRMGNGDTVVSFKIRGNKLLVFRWDTDDSARALNVFGNYAYVSDYRSGLQVIDVSDPMNPFLVNTILPHYDSVIYTKPIIQNEELIISDVCWNEILVYDLTYPAYPILSNSIKWNRPSKEIAATDEYLVSANGWSGFTILDIENLTPTSQNVIHPEEFSLNNYPNPFNPETTIVFSIEQNQQYEQAKIEIYNIKGQRIRELEIRNLKLGINEVVWNGNDDSNKQISSGIYLYKLILNGKTKEVRKCLLLK